MFKRRTLSRWISLLAALWLVGQLAAAFHVGHSETEGLGGAEHSCLLCKLATMDDVVTASSALSVALVFFVVATLALVLLAQRQTEWRFQARAPPAI